MCDELESCLPEFGTRRQKKKIFLAPRGCFKTSLIKAFMIFCYLKYPNIRIVYGRATHEDAKDVLLAVKETFIRNKVIAELWPNIEEEAVIWAEEKIVLSRPNPMLTEPTIDTTALGLSMTGTHPDLIILDDLVTEKNYRSEKTVVRSRDLLDSCYPVLDPHSSIIVCGTRWAANDIYGWLMSQDNELLEAEGGDLEWKLYIRAVVNDGVWFFPSRLSEQFIEQQRRSLRHNLMLFSSWYYNQPYEIGTKLFPKHLINYFDGQFWRSPAPHLVLDDGSYVPLYVSMTIDPAPTVGPYSDFTGITVVGCDWQGQWYVLAAHAIKKTPKDRANHVINLIRIFNPRVCGIEREQADPEFVAHLQTGITDLGISTSIQSYSAVRDEPRGQRGKGARIEALEPYFREGVIRLHRGVPMRELLEQLDGYPALDHDDVVDALAMQRLFVRSCAAKTEVDQVGFVESLEEYDSWGPDGKPAPPPRRGFQGGNVGRGSQYMRA